MFTIKHHFRITIGYTKDNATESLKSRRVADKFFAWNRGIIIYYNLKFPASWIYIYYWRIINSSQEMNMGNIFYLNSQLYFQHKCLWNLTFSVRFTIAMGADAKSCSSILKSWLRSDAISQCLRARLVIGNLPSLGHKEACVLNWHWSIWIKMIIF